jgi:PAS domain S-box-containing protein
MEIENKRTEDISVLQEEIKKLKEENEHLKSIHNNLLATFSNNRQQEVIQEYLLREYALNNSTESIITISAEGEILYLNDTTWKRLGYNKEDLINKNISILDPNFGPDIWPQYWARMKKLKTFSFFSHHKNKEGTLLPVEVTPTYLVYNGAEFCISFIKDVSNLKAAEEIISQTELLLTSVIINSSESIALSSVEGEDKYRLLYINNTNLEHINRIGKSDYTAKDLIGRLHDDIFINFYKTSDEDFEFDNKKRKEAIENKRSIFYEETFRWSEGIIHLESSITPIFNEDGKCTHTLWSARNITERKNAEEDKEILLNETLTLNEELKANEEELRQILDSTIELNSQIEQNELKLRAIFDSTQSINYLIDKNNKVLWFNKPANENVKKRFGRNVELDTDVKGYIDVPLHEIYQHLFSEALTGKTAIRELELKGRNSKTTWMQTKMIPVYKQERELIGISLTITDITESKNKEKELRQINQELIYQNEQLNQYSYIVSHNLRGPIATILGITNIFESENTTPELKEELVKHIQKSTNHLDSIIRDLNTILSQTKETDHNRTMVYFETELSVIKDLYKLQIEKAEAIIKADFSAAPSIFAIKSFMHSILSNLVSNSLKYKKNNVPVSISISTEIKNNYTILTHKDNGLGIDLLLHKDKIFGFYKRFHSHVEGKGMGLHLIKTQVEMMGGRIEVESEVNKGTTFRVILKNV